MGTAYLYGNGDSGGGSGGFGLQIVEGLVRPKNPTQGMIWAKTEHKVTYYDLSATKPENPVEGTLWISISDSGDKKIVSPVSKEWITVYPLSAEQYISGEWMSIETMSYQDVEWVDWIPDGALYYRGDEMIEKTGGWSAVAWVPNSNYTNVGLTFEKNEDHMSLGFSNQTAKARDWCIYSNNKIDMSKYNTLRINAEHSFRGTKIGLSSSKPSASATATWVASQAFSSQKDLGETVLDVSSYDASYYVVVWVYAETETTADINVYEIVAE